MSHHLVCRRQSFFGKRSAVDDYEWEGADRSPASFAIWGPLLITYGNAARKHVALVGKFEDQVWLACTSMGDYDRTGRSTLQVEVLLCEGAEVALRADQWVSIAAACIERASSSAPASYAEYFELNIEERNQESASPDLDHAMCAALGIEQALDVARADALLAWAFERYQAALVIHSEIANEFVAGTQLASQSILGVGFGRLPMNQHQKTLLDRCRALQPSLDELRELLSLSPAAACNLIDWVAGEGVPFPTELRSSTSRLQESLLRWASSVRPPADVLRIARDELKRHSLSERITRHAWGLSETAAATLFDEEKLSSAPQSAIEELSQIGLLANAALVPMRSWVHHVGASPVLLKFAEAQLAQSGLSSFADILLDHATIDQHSIASIAGASAAASSANALGIPAPKRTIRKLIGIANSGSEVESVRRFVLPFGVWATSVMALTTDGVIPEPGILAAEDLEAALSTRERLQSQSSSFAHTIAMLLRANRNEEAYSLLELGQRIAPSTMTATAVAALKARLGRGSAPLLSDVVEVRALLEVDALRAEDVIPATVEALVGLANHWPSLRALANPFTAVNEAIGLSNFPIYWRETICQLFTPDRIGAWMKRLDAEQLNYFIRWIGELQSISGETTNWLLNVGAPSADHIQSVLADPWVAAIVEALPFERRVGCLVRAAETMGIPISEHQLSHAIKNLLPQITESDRSLVVHALTKVGPMPVLEEVSSQVIHGLVAHVDTRTLVNSIMITLGDRLTVDANLIDRVATAVERSGISCPTSGYTRSQRTRHAPLALRLSKIAGWQAITPSLEVRRQWLMGLMVSAGITAAELLNDDTGGSASMRSDL